MIKNVWRLSSGRIAIAALSVILFLAVFGSLLSPHDPDDTVGPQLTGPSSQFLLGTDYIGRDVLSRVLAGAGLSVLGALLVAAIALLFGALPGVLSVYLGRVFEWVTLRVIDTLIALPFLVFAVAMTALLGNGVFQALFAVGFLLAPVFYRVSRSATLSVANSQFVEAAILSGASTWWVVRKHVWNKVAPPIAISLSTTIGLGLVVIASLTFLGIGVSPPRATWGGLLATDLEYIALQPWAPISLRCSPATSSPTRCGTRPANPVVSYSTHWRPRRRTKRPRATSAATLRHLHHRTLRTPRPPRL